MWTTGMHGYSRFSHQLNFQLTKADFPLALSPSCLWLQCDRVFLCSVSLLSWSCCLIWASPSQEEEGGSYWGRCGYSPVSGQPLDKGQFVLVSSGHEWDLYSRETLGVLSLLLFTLSFWRRILTSAPMLTPSLPEYMHSCSWARQLPQGLIQAKSNLA